MEKLILSVPAMYADHHVLSVRRALSGLAGVTNVEASSALKIVRVEYDPDKVTPQAIMGALDAAGYGSREEPLGRPPTHHEEESAWHTFVKRVTNTNRLDLEMSGDFRKY